MALETLRRGHTERLRLLLEHASGPIPKGELRTHARGSLRGSLHPEPEAAAVDLWQPVWLEAMRLAGPDAGGYGGASC